MIQSHSFCRLVVAGSEMTQSSSQGNVFRFDLAYGLTKSEVSFFLRTEKMCIVGNIHTPSLFTPLSLGSFAGLAGRGDLYCGPCVPF